MPSNHVEPIRDDEFPELTAAGDPALRLAAWLIRKKDFRQLAQRTGVRAPRAQHSGAQSSPKVRLPAVIRLEAGRLNAQTVGALAEEFGVPRAYGEAMRRNRALTHATARLPLHRSTFAGSTESLVRAVKDLQRKKVTRVCLGAPGQPSRKRTELAEIGVPDDRGHNTHALSGEGVIIGIIDDGCALANVDFMKPRVAGANPQSRILYLWDQEGTGNVAAGWAPMADFDGLELGQAAIDAVLLANLRGDRVDEEAVYRQLRYPIREIASHGTHVMGIAAGTGQSVMGAPGVAPGADIIFVQLPVPAIEGGATVLWRHVLDGVAYILARANALNRPAVVNISYGGYDGPHDGTTEFERTLDEMLTVPDRAVVLAAGNGFEARCHAVTEVRRNRTASLRWILGPQDPTGNTVELWYDATSTLQVRLCSPGPAIDPSGWIQIGQATTPIMRTSDGKTIGYVEHLQSGTGNGANCIVLTLNATDTAAENGDAAPAPSGTWTIDLKHAGGKKAKVHAWIWRDDSGRPRDARLRQSRFHPDDAHPASSIGGWATSQKSISVGAFNTATLEVCRYSASGPTRDGRKKPEIYAPAEDDARGRGILSASARSARPRRMNGTSVAAPFISGIIALILEYAKKHARGAPSLTADQIRAQLRAASPAGRLRQNRRQAADRRVRIKQKDVRGDLLDKEKVDYAGTMRRLFP